MKRVGNGSSLYEHSLTTTHPLVKLQTNPSTTPSLTGWNFIYNSAATPKAAIPTAPLSNIPGKAVGAAAPGLEEEEAAAPPPVCLAVFVVWPPVSVTPFETVMSWLDCVGAVLLGKDIDGKVMLAGAEVALEAAGAELVLTTTAVEEELCASDWIAIAATSAMMLRRMVVRRSRLFGRTLFGILALCRGVL